MFGFLKDKLKKAISVFTKKAEEIPVEKAEPEKIEEKAEKEKVVEFAAKSKPVKQQELMRETKSEGTKAVEKKEIEEKKGKSAKEEAPAKEKKIEEKKQKPVETKKEEQKFEETRKEERAPVKDEIKITKEEPKLVKEEAKTAEEEKIEEPLQIEPPVVEKKGFFAKIKDKFVEAVTTTTISEKKFDELFWELEMAMLENNVAVEVIEKIKDDLKKEIVDKHITRGKVEEKIISSLKKSVESLFDVEQIDLLERANALKGKKPLVICFVGINGSGKTTTIAKIADYLHKNKLTTVIAAADTFRAAAIDQLQMHADKLGTKLIKQDYGSDAAAVAFDAIKHAEAARRDVVLIDTAGRLHSNVNLVDEMKKIIRVAKPDLKIFVGESITGNDCVEQAQKFNEAIGIDGIVLSKADVDEKGGAALSVTYITKKPILFIGTGQEYKDLKKFDKEIVIRGLGL